MTYGVHRRGHRISRQILSGLNCFTDGLANQLVGDAYVNSTGFLVTRQAYVDTITVQLPQPRQNAVMSAYVATYPTTAFPLPNPTDAIWYFWDIEPFNSAAFLNYPIGNPIVGLPHPDTCVLQIRPWGNGASGGGVGTTPASDRTSTTGSYTMAINRYFKNGLLAFFQNPEKLAIVTYAGGAGTPFHAGRILLGNGGAGGSGTIRADLGGTIILERDSVTTHFVAAAALTENPAGATANLVTYEAQLLQQLNCQVNMVWHPTQIR